MPRTLRGVSVFVLSGLGLGGGLAAQQLADEIEAAEQLVAARNWTAALDRLVALQERAASAGHLERIIEQLEVIQENLMAAAELDTALRASQTIVAMRRRLHGNRDHRELSRSINNLAYLLWAMGRPDEALPQYETAIAMLRRCSDEDDLDLAASLNNQATCLGSLGRSTEAIALHEEALAMRRRLLGEGDHAEIARSLINLASELEASGRVKESIELLQQALAMGRRLHDGDDHPDLVTNLGNLATILEQHDRARDALPYYREALAMQQRLSEGDDDRAQPTLLAALARCLEAAGHEREALPLHEQALAMQRRLDGDGDHAAVATLLDNLASGIEAVGRLPEALVLFEQALAMRKRVFDGPHEDVVHSMNNLAVCLDSLGRSDEAIAQYQAALATLERLHEGRDHPARATMQNNLGVGLAAVGRQAEALAQHEEALAMCRRLYGPRDSHLTQQCLGAIGHSLDRLGRAAEALPYFEAALAMGRRMHGSADHPDVAQGINNLGSCLGELGRTSEALALYADASAMWRRIHGDIDHPSIAFALANQGISLFRLGRPEAALPLFEAALAMRERLYGDKDHPEVLASRNDLALCLEKVGRTGEALQHAEAALAAWRLRCGERDHPNLALALNNVATCLGAVERFDDALPLQQASLAMWQRLVGERDHPQVARAMKNLGSCEAAVGRTEAALALFGRSAAMIERLRDDSRLAPETRQSFFDELKDIEAFEHLQYFTHLAGREAESWHAGERSRARGLLDRIDERFDAMAEAERRARSRGDAATADRLVGLAQELQATTLEDDRVLHLLVRLADQQMDDQERARRRADLLARSNALTQQRRRLHDEQARLLGDVLPVGRVRTAAEVQAALRPDEALLQFTISRDFCVLYVLERDAPVAAFDLPARLATIQAALPDVLRAVAPEQADARGRNPGSGKEAPLPAATTRALQELFAGLMPAAAWERLRGKRRVFLAAHRDLHRLPFEMLVTGVVDDKPVHWLDQGPPIAYVPSGSALHWLRQRARDAGDDATALDLLAVGDPSSAGAPPDPPELGVYVAAVNDGGEGARVGLQAGDVLLRYDGRALTDDRSLFDERVRTEVAIEDGKRNRDPVAIEVWRHGVSREILARAGRLDIQVLPGRARAAYEASLAGAEQLARPTRAGEIERIARLPPLRGARAEAQAIATVFATKQRTTRSLLGAEATESAVFDLAATAKYVHFACHGIAEEYAAQSLSMMVLAQPVQVSPGDDGLLKLGELLHGWRGRLASCRLIVLSACRTNVGPTNRDDSPQALPLGFLFAGAPSVVSSLWAVDDASTRELMTDFYGRLLAGETDKLAAFTAARKALRARYPDPFHWAPFLFLGSPD